MVVAATMTAVVSSARSHPQTFAASATVVAANATTTTVVSVARSSVSGMAIWVSAITTKAAAPNRSVPRRRRPLGATAPTLPASAEAALRNLSFT